MTDVQAAIGRVQLERLPEIVARRRVLAERYATLLADVAGVRPPTEPAWARSNWQSYCVRLPAGVGQHAVMQALLDQGVSTRRGIMCSHREQAYALEPWSCGSGPGLCGCKPGTCRRLPESERAQDETLLLPLYPQMTDEQQDYVVAQLAAAIAAPVGAQG
jgi:dTDP-4-amino-4,6-dideoxygalactose transaminase